MYTCILFLFSLFPLLLSTPISLLGPKVGRECIKFALCNLFLCKCFEIIDFFAIGKENLRFAYCKLSENF